MNISGFPTDVRHPGPSWGSFSPDGEVEMERSVAEDVGNSTPAVKSDDLCNIFVMWNYPNGAPLCLGFARICSPRFQAAVLHHLSPNGNINATKVGVFLWFFCHVNHAFMFMC